MCKIYVFKIFILALQSFVALIGHRHEVVGKLLNNYFSAVVIK